jgi:hypothetical protein
LRDNNVEDTCKAIKIRMNIMSRKILLTVTCIAASLSIAEHSLASTLQTKKECVRECEAKSEELGGQLVHKRYTKKISKEEYDKLSKSLHNEDLVCIKECKKGQGSKLDKSEKKS